MEVVRLYDQQVWAAQEQAWREEKVRAGQEN